VRKVEEKIEEIEENKALNNKKASKYQFIAFVSLTFC